MADSNSNEGPSILCVILDVNWYWWDKVLDPQHNDGSGSGADSGTGPLVVDGVIAFCGAHLMQNSRHRLLLMTAGSSGSCVVFPELITERSSVDEPSTSVANQSSSLGKTGRMVSASFETSKVRRKIQDVFTGETSSVITGSAVVETKMAGCFSQALCYINRLTKSCMAGHKGHARSVGEARILVVKVSDDATSQYMNLMNTFFTAQKSHITIDACLLHQPSTIFEQACDITGGICLQLPSIRSLLQYLMAMFAIPPSCRAGILLPRNGNVDYRAACFCHQKLVDIAFVCSVCLSVFCVWRPICSTCDTHFPLLYSSRALGASRKRKLQQQSAGGSNASTPCDTPSSTPPATPLPMQR